MEQRTIGSVSRLSGLTVRTLHHYDRIGLMTPSTRLENGYRVYSDDDLERLRRILIYRELGLNLSEIGRILDADRDAADSMLMERTKIVNRIGRLNALVSALDNAISAEREGSDMTAEERLKIFGDFDPQQHDDETIDRWGNTEAYAQSTTRTAAYTARDWTAIKDEETSIYGRFVRLLEEGVPANDPRTALAVDDHREHISRWYYSCSASTHASLGQLYITDSRFTKNIDTAGEGLAAYMSEAISAKYS